MESKDFIFELLVIDPNGKSEIKTTKSMLHGLLSTDIIWDKPSEIKEDEILCIQDGDLKLKIKPIDTSAVLYDLIESAFLIKVRCSDFNKIEKFRYQLVLHLKSRLRFNHIRILKDDVSTDISNKIYPQINELENLLRRYLVKFFTQKIGLDWWKQAVPESVLEKTKTRKNNETLFSNLVETDLTLIDFDDLGEIIYKYKLGINKPESIIDKVLNISTIDDLNKLKTDLDSNYNRFFKENFKRFDFDSKWKKLFIIRNKVAHNNLFEKKDLLDSEFLYNDLKEIITNAESKIDEFKFSLEDQVAIREAITITARWTDPVCELKKVSSESDSLNSEKDLSEKEINEKINSVEELDNYEIDEINNISNFKIISEDELIKELQRAEYSLQNSHLSYVGLKSFVTKVLGYKRYAYGPTYALVNILKDKGIVEIYDVEDENSFYPVKAIRLID